jgi:hypothetical protein
MSMYLRKNVAWLVLFSLFIVVSIPAMAQVAWVKSFDDALKQAAKENKFIVLDISASW